MGVMPKERINDTAGTYDVIVGWRPDSDVQVGVETAAGYSMLYGDNECLARLAGCIDNDVRYYHETAREATDQQEHLHALGRRILDQIEACQTNPGEPSYAWSILGRQQCNRLIRVLRRARDQAYGRDE